MATEGFWQNARALRYWLEAAERNETGETCEDEHERCALKAGGACRERVRARLAELSLEEVAA